MTQLSAALLSSTDAGARAICEELAKLQQASGVELLHAFVDTDKQAVARLVAAHELAPAQVAASGQGREDFVWRAFSSLVGVTMRTPLFALVDRAGVLQFAGHDVGELARACQGR